MKDANRPISLGLYVLVLFSFLLPLARMSGCHSTVQVTGYQLALGKGVHAKPDTPGGKAAPPGRPAHPDFVAIAVLVAALVGIWLTRLRGRHGARVRSVYSGHCLLLPLALWVDLLSKEEGTVRLLVGYWATVALFGAACIVNFIAIWFLPRPAPSAPGTSQVHDPSSP
jgi:hypothetical protein